MHVYHTVDACSSWMVLVFTTTLKMDVYRATGLASVMPIYVIAI